MQKGIDQNHTINLAGHSQGGLITYRAIDGLDFTNGEPNTKTGTIQLSGAPVRATKFFKVAQESGFKVNEETTDSTESRVVFQVNRPDGKSTIFGTRVVDSVADMPLLGNNWNRERPVSFIDSFASIPLVLFGGDKSPHSDYICQGVACAGGQQPSVEHFRNTHPKPILILHDGSQVRAQ
ncbi:MAG: hypothetical protein HUJ28_11345 [Chromatiales bacterium]|nr:hypothetical protein [Chromatiales bacterium]